jgi:mannose-1-phosphate guanylyltransferase/mannose-6-phosphate isomerase
MLIQVTPVILCGGSGTRLWPLSRKGFPKQFLVLSGTKSLFQQAISRVNNLNTSEIKINSSLIVTNEEHRFLVLDQLRETPEISALLLLEPIARNTAPALTLAALQATVSGEDPVLVVTPADQTVQDVQSFNLALQNSIRVAASGSIVILGITPNKPENGFGYIKCQGGKGFHGEYDIEEFIEKPDLKTAEVYCASDNYSWNAGIFVVRASVWLHAIKKFRKDILDTTTNAFEKRTLDKEFIRPNQKLFEIVPNDSVDYAVMENCPGSDQPIKMIHLDAGWNDLGTWDAVWEIGNQDLAGNVVQGDVLLEDTRNMLVYANHRLVSVLGVSNLVVVETPDAVLVADRGMSQNVKKIVSELEKMDREESVLHRKVSRPWGWYDTIDIGDCFKVKRIQVNPGASLSLQKHLNRAEHWVVVKGVAEIICGDKKQLIYENQSTFIPLGVVHRLTNPRDSELEIIEIQTGAFLDEQDIVRIQDEYQRT